MNRICGIIKYIPQPRQPPLFYKGRLFFYKGISYNIGFLPARWSGIRLQKKRTDTEQQHNRGRWTNTVFFVYPLSYRYAIFSPFIWSAFVPLFACTFFTIYSSPCARRKKLFPPVILNEKLFSYSHSLGLAQLEYMACNVRGEKEYGSKKHLEN